MKLKNNQKLVINLNKLDPTLIMISCWKLHQLLSQSLYQQLVVELHWRVKNEIKK